MKSKNNIKISTLKKNEDFKKIIFKNKPIKSKIFTLWKENINSNNQTVVGIVVSKKNFKKAVTRNKIKRQIKNMLTKINLKNNKVIIIRINQNYIVDNFEYNFQKLEELIIQKG